MTEKEKIKSKANEIFEKHLRVVKTVGVLNIIDTLFISRKCSIFEVDGIIGVLVDISVMESGSEHIDYGQNFWREVKKELKKLHF